MRGPREIRAECRRLWDSGRVMRAWLGADDLFPWSLPLSPPQGERLPEALVGLGEWKAAIEAGCKCADGEGYRIEYLELEDGRLGCRRLPQRVVFDTPLDLAGYLGKSGAMGEFARLSREIRRRFPPLAEWVQTYPLQVLALSPQWPRLLAVLEWFLAHPRPNLHLRELVIPGVDTQFIEEHKQLLWQLLDYLMPEEGVDQAVTSLACKGFERRFGLRYDQP